MMSAFTLSMSSQCFRSLTASKPLAIVTRLEWSRSAGGRGTARGVDIFTVRDGKIAEKPTYVTTG